VSIPVRSSEKAPAPHVGSRARSAFRLLDRLLVLAVLATAWRFFERPQSGTAEDHPPIAVGAQLDLPGVQWTAGSLTVVLFVHTDCVHCRNSLGFYRDLVSAAQEREGNRVVVASVEAPSKVRAWLREGGTSVEKVVQVRRAAALGLSLTPTILFVNNEGGVTDALLGALDPTQRAGVMGRVRGAAAPERLDNTGYVTEINEAMLAELQKERLLAIVDARDRERFRFSRARVGAINIPIDELSSRAPAELEKARLTVIECPAEPAHRCRQAGRTVRSLGFDVRVLRSGQ
jgi:hypothetical protein